MSHRASSETEVPPKNMVEMGEEETPMSKWMQSLGAVERHGCVGRIQSYNAEKGLWVIVEIMRIVGILPYPGYLSTMTL